MNLPLRYRISDWRQLKDCKSNNSRDLSISVTTFTNDSRLNGQRISINHSTFGSLFSCVVGARGSIITDSSVELTPAQILEQLKRYGFLVEYSPSVSISGNQIQLLMTLNSLKFDKIRILSVYDSSELSDVESKHLYVVCFNCKYLQDWMNPEYSCSSRNFSEALIKGHAMNVSEISERSQFDWSWLYGWVGNIDDILRDQSFIGGLQ